MNKEYSYSICNKILNIKNKNLKYNIPSLQLTIEDSEDCRLRSRRAINIGSIVVGAARG